MAFQKEIMSVETLTDKAVKLAVDELKNVIKGGAVSINISSVIDKAKAECLLAVESLAKMLYLKHCHLRRRAFLTRGKPA
jgi:hypothetical protein